MHYPCVKQELTDGRPEPGGSARLRAGRPATALKLPYRKGLCPILSTGVQRRRGRAGARSRGAA